MKPMESPRCLRLSVLIGIGMLLILGCGGGDGGGHPTVLGGGSEDDAISFTTPAATSDTADRTTDADRTTEETENASGVGTPAPAPVGVYVLGPAGAGPSGLLNAYNNAIATETESGRDLFVGYVLRVAMDDLITNDNDTSGAIQYDFSPIFNALTAIQQETEGVRAAGYRDRVTLQVQAWPQLVSTHPIVPRIVLAQIPDSEEYVNNGVTLPVPWSPSAVNVLTEFYAALANAPITDYSQPGNPTVLLKDHPTLANINVVPIGHKGYRDNVAGTTIPQIVSSTGITYNRDAYVTWLLGSIAAATTAFPNDFGWVQYFGFQDGKDAQYGGETLDQRVKRELDPLYNGAGQSSFGVWRENLSDDEPSVGRNLLDYEAAGFVDDPEGHILFQALQSWLVPASDPNEAKTDSGTATNGMLFGYTQYGSRYLEVYLDDVALEIPDIQAGFADVPHGETDAEIQTILQDLLVDWNRYLINGPGVVADSATVNQDSGANTIQVMANDAPPPGPGPWDNPNTDFPTATDLLQLTVTAVTQGANGTVAIAANGIDVIYTPNPGFSGTDSFTYTAGDQYILKATTTVTVTVVP